MSALKFSFVRPASFSDLRQQLAALISALRRLFTSQRGSGPSGENPGLCQAGECVPVRPTPPHHLVAAKEFPPSDKTHSFPRD